MSEHFGNDRKRGSLVASVALFLVALLFLLFFYVDSEADLLRLARSKVGIGVGALLIAGAFQFLIRR